jgi:transketolase
VLSAGHGSMLLYACLHLSGYPDMTLEEIRHFRTWGSRTPGHPEVHHTAGVEVTTGPLGQGVANAVGLALAERFLREKYGSEVQNHHTYGICSDGDLMEGVSAEAASLAGHLGLGQLIFFYDHNHISIDGRTSLAFDTEDVNKRFDAYGWHTQDVDDANDLDALRAAVKAAQEETGRPSLIRVRSTIGFPAPNKQGTPGAHGAALGEDEVRATKEVLGWDPDKHFFIPDGVYEQFSAVERGERLQAEWQERYEAWRAADPTRAEEWDLAWAGKPLPGLDAALPTFDPNDKPKLATRAASHTTIQAIAPFLPTQVGGSADLNESVKTGIEADAPYSREQANRNVYWGIREHAMGAAVNGMALHGGIVRPIGATFLQFADYMRPAIRLSALMNLPTLWVFSHDSIALGEDGPTHQPVEHIAALRAIPNLTVIRPSDAAETAEAWRVAVDEEVEGPVLLILSRQNLPVLDRTNKYASAKGLDKGAYVLAEVEDAVATIVGTGSEVQVAIAAAELLAEDGVKARVVAMPSWELFEQQDEAYRLSVLPADQPKVSVEAGIHMGWERWVDASVSVDRFGASAAGEVMLEKYGVTPQAVADKVRGLL